MIDLASVSALFLSFKLAFISSLILLLIATPVAYWLATSNCKIKFIIEAVVALPLVLPPTVLGFYLLLLLNPDTYISHLFFKITGENLIFSFSALVIGSIIYSLPFAVQPINNSFRAIEEKIIDSAKIFNSKKLDRFFYIILPLSKSGFITAAILSFAHTLGEFGVVLMLGGNIPGKTQVASIAIYDKVEAINYTQAHWLAGILIFLSLCFLSIIFKINHKSARGVNL